MLLPPNEDVRMQAFCDVFRRMIETILEHETSQRGSQFTVRDLLEELDAARDAKNTNGESARGTRKQVA